MTDIYPAFFSATALLKPRNAPPEALFQISDPTVRNGYRKLYPKPEDVKVAIEAFKKAGMTARFGLSHALDVSGPVEALQKVFGVGIRGVYGESGELLFSLVDDGEDVVELAKPVDRHPIGAWVEALYLPAPAAKLNDQPRHPQATGDQIKKWGKKDKVVHLWPHELRQRLDAGDNPIEKEIAQMNGNAWKANKAAEYIPLGRKQTVTIVDSGIESAHHYFDDLGLDAFIGSQRGGSRNRLAIAPPLGQMDRPRQAANYLHGEIAAVNRKLAPFAEKIKQNQLLVQGGYTINPAVIADLKSDLDSLGREPGYAKALAWFEQSLDSRARQEFQKNLGVINADGNFFAGSPPYWTLVRFKDYVASALHSARAAVQALAPYGRANVDPDGHGTRMAASALGVARLARIRVHAAMLNFDTSTHGWVVGNTQNDVRIALERAINEAINSGKPQIISNSWGSIWPLTALKPATAALKADLATLVPLIERALGHNHVLIFSAGNARYPDENSFSLEATTGYFGAIVVGGAWDENETVNDKRQPIVRFSNAAHGLRLEIPVTDKNGGTTNKTTEIPTTCGLVGPERAFDSTYLYTPTRGGRWDYTGAGTSSAAAQVAGLCACLREKYPDMAVGKIVNAIRAGGAMIISKRQLAESVSYQGYSAENISPFLRRASISGAMREAAKQLGSGTK